MNVWTIPLGTLLAKQRVAEVIAQFLTLRDVFKVATCCRDLMNRLVLVGGSTVTAGGQDTGARQ